MFCSSVQVWQFEFRDRILGLTERTVSRRYHRLRSRLALRVVGVMRPAHGSSQDWLLRIAAPASVSNSLARVLAARDDTSWIASLAGDGRLACILRTPSSSDDGAGEIDAFRRLTGVTSVTAQRLVAPSPAPLSGR